MLAYQRGIRDVGLGCFFVVVAGCCGSLITIYNIVVCVYYLRFR